MGVFDEVKSMRKEFSSNRVPAIYVTRLGHL